MTERIVDVFWEGPYRWLDRAQELKPGHVLYALYGAHHSYGHNVLLYIGRTNDMGKRLIAHAPWVQDEYDAMTFRVASLGEISTWDGWDSYDRYDSAPPEVVAAAEALLIYGLQPAYNRANKETIAAAKGYRLFNTGHIGMMLPEISYRYHDENW